MQSRREFIKILAGMSVLIVACGKEESTTTKPTSNNDPVTTSKVGEVEDNHGHRAVITSAQLTSGQGISLNIQFQADHSHTLALTSADLTNIRRGTRFSKSTTTSGGHSHMVIFNPGAV